MALGYYIYGGNTTTTTTSGTTNWIDIYRHDMEKAEILAQTRDKAAKERQFSVPRGTSVLAALQTEFDAWAGDVRAEIFN